MRLSLIVAMARNGVIGRGGGLPWKLSADLKRFKGLTMDHTIIMGRKTWESLGRALPGRMSIVVTHQTDFQPPAGVLVAHSLDEAQQLIARDEEPFVIGGGDIFRQALGRADRLYVTWVESEVDGDTFFPKIDWSHWHEISREHHSADAKNEYDTTFAIYDRIVT